MFRQVFNVFFIKGEHFGREHKDRHSVYFAMSKKSKGI
jgi:hypothetical protein